VRAVNTANGGRRVLPVTSDVSDDSGRRGAWWVGRGYAWLLLLGTALVAGSVLWPTATFAAGLRPGDWSPNARRLAHAVSAIPFGEYTLAMREPTEREPRDEEAPAASWLVLFYIGYEDETGDVLGSLMNAEKAPGVVVYALCDRATSPDEVYRFCGKPARGDDASGVDVWLPRELGLGVDEFDTGDADTLVWFVNWALAREHPRNLMLTIWHHGAGAGSGHGIGGICFDESGSCLSTSEVRTVFTNLSMPVDVLHLNTCLTQTLEVLWEFPEPDNSTCGVRHVVGSEDLTWPDPEPPSWEAEVVAAIENSMSAETLARFTAESYHWEMCNADSVTGEEWYHTVSVADLRRMGRAKKAFSSFCRRLRDALPKYAPEIRLARAAAQKFDEDSDGRLTPDDAYIDLWHFAYLVGRLMPETDPDARRLRRSARRLTDALRDGNGLVTYSRHDDGVPGQSFAIGIWDEESTNGVSIYFPRTGERWGQSDYRTQDGGGLALVCDTQWDEFLNDLFAYTALNSPNAANGAAEDR
jgi:hypothetical protein